MGAIEIAGSIISRATQRVEISAQNMANMTTPGYKARHQFSTLIIAPQNNQPISFVDQQNQQAIDFTNGKLTNTGNPFDLAISGSGFFVVQSAGGTFFTRNGQFSRDADGHLVTPDGMILQSATGDVTVGGSDVKILSDGTVLDGGQPAARLAIADFADPHTLQPAGAGLFAAPAGAARDVASPQIRQGMLETSNVSTADEMLSVMAALRSAETGQRVVQVYDDLMGRALTAFGQM